MDLPIWQYRGEKIRGGDEKNTKDSWGRKEETRKIRGGEEKNTNQAKKQSTRRRGARGVVRESRAAWSRKSKKEMVDAAASRVELQTTTRFGSSLETLVFGS